MIKKEQGVLTALSKGINNISKEDTIAGMRFVAEIDERVLALVIEKERLRKARLRHLQESLNIAQASDVKNPIKEINRLKHLEKTLNREKISNPKKAFNKNQVIKSEERYHEGTEEPKNKRNEQER